MPCTDLIRPKTGRSSSRSVRASLIYPLITVVAGQTAGLAAAAEFNIIQKGRAFDQAEIQISTGDLLHLLNQDEFIHQIYVDSPQLSFDSAEQSPGESISIKFPNAGDYRVLCHIHPKMLLLVHVK